MKYYGTIFQYDKSLAVLIHASRFSDPLSRELIVGIDPNQI